MIIIAVNLLLYNYIRGIPNQSEPERRKRGSPTLWSLRRVSVPLGRLYSINI